MMIDTSQSIRIPSRISLFDVCILPPRAISRLSSPRRRGPMITTLLPLFAHATSMSCGVWVPAFARTTEELLRRDSRRLDDLRPFREVVRDQITQHLRRSTRRDQALLA